MAGKPLSEIVEAGWAQALAPVEPVIAQMGEFLRTELGAGRRDPPAGANVLRAFTRPFDEVRVLIVGRLDALGHAVGLSFSVAPDVRPIPRLNSPTSTASTRRPRHPAPSTGDLTPWADRGRAAAEQGPHRRAGSPGSHRGRAGRPSPSGDPRAGGPGGRAAGGDPLGSRRTEPDPVARRRALRGVGAPVTDVGGPRLLRLAAVEPRQRAAGGAGRGAVDWKLPWRHAIGSRCR